MLEQQTSTESKPGVSEFLTLRDIAEVLGVSRDTVRRILQRGEMAYVRTGSKSIRVHKDSFSAWRRTQEAASRK